MSGEGNTVLSEELACQSSKCANRSASPEKSADTHIGQSTGGEDQSSNDRETKTEEE